MGLMGLTGLTGLIRLMGLIKFKVKITKKGYRVNPYNLFAFKSPTPAPLKRLAPPLLALASDQRSSEGGE